MPATAKRAEGAAFEARLDRSGAAAADMVTADLKVLRSNVPGNRVLRGVHGPCFASAAGSALRASMSMTAGSRTLVRVAYNDYACGLMPGSA